MIRVAAATVEVGSQWIEGGAGKTAVKSWNPEPDEANVERSIAAMAEEPELTSDTHSIAAERKSEK